MNFHLENRVALIAGSSSGLGFASAMTLAKEKCRVVICSRNQVEIDKAYERIKKETGSSVLPICADVSNKSEIKFLINEIKTTYNQLDIVVANSGGPPLGTFQQQTDENWNFAIRNNFLGVVWIFREALPLLCKSDQGRLLAITSTGAKQPLSNLILSNTTRSSVHALIKTISKEIENKNVTVNAVCPGRFLTERQIKLVKGVAQEKDLTFEQALSERVKNIPLGRMGEPDEFAAAIAFLCSRQAAYITGIALPVDGGMISSI